MREVIGDAIFKIRFPTMTVQDFANSVSTIDGFLTDLEMRQIYQMITVFDQKNIECPFSNKFRCQSSQFYVPMKDMRELLQQKLLYRNGEKQSLNMKSLVDHAENLGNGASIFEGSFRLLLQCCADMANTSIIERQSKQGNIVQRKKFSNKFKEWEIISASNQLPSVVKTCILSPRCILSNLFF